MVFPLFDAFWPSFCGLSAIVGDSFLFRGVGFSRGAKHSSTGALFRVRGARSVKASPMSARKPVLSASYSYRGFLPSSDPAFAFPNHSELAKLDSIGRELPSLL